MAKYLDPSGLKTLWTLIKTNTSNQISKIDVAYVDKKIYLTSNGEKVGAGFDASDFIKDGMITDVELVKENDKGTAGNFLKITWNTDAKHTPTVSYIDLQDLIDVYVGDTKTSGATSDGVNVNIDGKKVTAQLTSGTKASLAKANSAVQSIQVNGVSATKSNGVASVTVSDADITTKAAIGGTTQSPTYAAGAKLSDVLSGLDKRLTANDGTAKAAVKSVTLNGTTINVTLNDGSDAKALLTFGDNLIVDGTTVKGKDWSSVILDAAQAAANVAVGAATKAGSTTGHVTVGTTGTGAGDASFDLIAGTNISLTRDATTGNVTIANTFSHKTGGQTLSSATATAVDKGVKLTYNLTASADGTAASSASTTVTGSDANGNVGAVSVAVKDGAVNISTTATADAPIDPEEISVANLESAAWK